MSSIVRIIIGIVSYILAHWLFSDIRSTLAIIGGFIPVSWLIESFNLGFLPDHEAFRFTGMTLLITVLFFLFVIWNVFVFILFHIDKLRAINGEWRIKEKTLLLCAVLFGAAGAWEAVFNLRHKSKHWNFKIIISLALFVQLFFLFCLLRLSIISWEIYHLVRVNT